MRKLAYPLLIATLFASLAFDDPASQPAKTDWAAISKGLSSEDYKEREAAQKLLNAIPEDDINSVRTLAASEKDEEVKARLEARAAEMQKTIDNYFNTGNEKYNKQDWRGALSDYSKGLAIHPENVDALVSRGNTRDELGDPTGALADYTRALQLNPMFADAYFNRGITRLRQGDPDGCLEDYNKAISLSPNIGIYYFYRTVVEERKGDAAGARLDFDRAISLNPSSSDQYTFRGAFRQRQGDPEGAMADYNQALTINPKSGWSYQYRGVLHFDLQEWNLALTDFRHDAEYDPADNYSRVRIYLTRARQGNKEAAAKELADFLDARKEKTADWPVTLCQYLAGRIAEDDFIKAVEKDKNSQHLCQAYYCIANARLISGDRAGAAAFFEKSAATNEKGDLCYSGAVGELKRLKQNP